MATPKRILGRVESVPLTKNMQKISGNLFGDRSLYKNVFSGPLFSSKSSHGLPGPTSAVGASKGGVGVTNIKVAGRTTMHKSLAVASKWSHILQVVIQNRFAQRDESWKDTLWKPWFKSRGTFLRES